MGSIRGIPLERGGHTSMRTLSAVQGTAHSTNVIFEYTCQPDRPHARHWRGSGRTCAGGCPGEVGAQRT